MPPTHSPSSQHLPQHFKKIRSFVLRQGRLTAAQQWALDTQWETFCLDHNQHYDLAGVFGRNAPLVVEIGFGNGEGLAAMAASKPEWNFIGIEVHRPGVGHLLMLAARQGLYNVRVFCHDAVEILEQQIPDHCLAAVHLFFPDPWPKRKHHKRRIVTTAFVDLVARKLAGGGRFHAATDWKPYAEWMLVELRKEPRLQNINSEGGYCPRPAERPMTKFEQRGIKLGHKVWDLVFVRK